MRHFERDAIPYALETDWLGRRDSNLCISESEFGQTLSLGREDSNLCISESEFAKTLRSGREHSNVRISIEVVVPHLIPKERLRP